MLVPHHKIAKGAKARGGIGLNIWITGFVIALTIRLHPINNPTPNPRLHPMANPEIIR